MFLRGIEYYDIIDWGGGSENIVQNSSLIYSIYPVNHNSMYQYDGLFLNIFAAYYESLPNDIWINYMLQIINFSANKDNQALGIYVPCSKAFTYKYKIIPKITNWGGSANGMYNIESSYIGNSANALGISRSTTMGVSLGNTPPSGFHLYNIHVINNTVEYYIDGIYKGTKTQPYNYFVINAPYLSALEDINNSYDTASLKWIAITNNAISKIPKNPYCLDEKENNMYGYLKETGE